MIETIYVDGVAVGLVLSAVCHLLLPGWTGRVMSQVDAVRVLGAALLVLAVPCLLWRGWYFWTLFGGLADFGSVAAFLAG